MGPKNERFREVLFWVSATLLALVIIAMDRAVLFVYLPRWTFALPVVLFLFPSRVNSTYWVRAATCVMLVVLPYALAPVRWNLLKSFYVDCDALKPGIAFADALARMSAYDGHPPEWMAGATMQGVQESPAERTDRVIIIPSALHSADWCILYPEEERLARVEIHPD